jgi:hypothetical protein
VNNAKRSSPFIGAHLCLKIGKPAQSAQPRHEAVFAPARDDEVRNAMKALSHRLPRHCETTLVGGRSDDRIFIVASTEENAVIDPFRLYELELPAQVRPYECEHQTTVGSVVFDEAFGKWWTICRSTPDHPVYARHAGYLRVSWIGAPDVRAAWSLKTYRVVRLKKKVVVAMRIFAKRWVVVERTKRQRSAAAPATHHLRRDQFLCIWSIRVGFKKTAKLSNALV